MMDGSMFSASPVPLLPSLQPSLSDSSSTVIHHAPALIQPYPPSSTPIDARDRLTEVDPTNTAPHRTAQLTEDVELLHRVGAVAKN
jgi:hypothetical protein